MNENRPSQLQISEAVFASDEPVNEWYYLKLWGPFRYAVYRSDDGGEKVMSIQFSHIDEFDNQTVSVLVYESEELLDQDAWELVTAEFQVDDSEIHDVSCNEIGCLSTFPSTANLFALLRSGKSIRFGGQLKEPPERDFRTVSLEGIAEILDRVEAGD